MSIDRYDAQQRITPEEAAAYSHYASRSEYDTAEAIANAYIRADGYTINHRLLWMNAVIYHAGRIAGIREERARRRARAAARGGGESNRI
ncbi:MAG: hypothetical protein IKO47_14055 [Ruminococcus sp.]|nr:hypothetical protein [Ruminococcus sp.]MBR4628786.1 hypothetical protein [Ruminococcus sp.]